MKELKEEYLGKAILQGTKVVPVKDILEWGRWYETADRTVKVTVLNKRKKIYVSTVFLGMDHGFFSPVPLWFETMVFGTSIDQAQWRYSDWESAARGHEMMVRRARQARQLRNTFNRRKLFRRMRRSTKFLRRILDN